MARVQVVIYLILFVAAAACGADDGEWVMRARRAETSPVIDGVMEVVWFEAEPAGGFKLFRPTSNQQAL